MVNFNLHPIAKNILSLATGQTLNLLLNFLSITLVARYLGVNNFGVFSYSVALVMIITKLIDFGLVPIAFRETSKNQNDFRFLNTSITLRSILFVIILPLFNLIIFNLNFSKTEIILLNILFINVFISSKFQNIRELLDLPFKITLTSHYSMFAILFDNIIFLILILIMPLISVDILYVVVAYVISNLPGFLYIIYTLYKKYNYKFYFSFYKAQWLLKESFPLFVYVILAVLFQQMDIIILKSLDSGYAVGIYSAAMRLTLPLMIIPSAIVSTAFPTLVKNVGVDEEKNLSINKFLLKLLFFISFSLAIVISLKAEVIIGIIFGIGFVQAFLPMILLLLVQIFLFNNFFIINLLTAYNKQRKTIIYALVIVIINLVANLILIPLFSYNGAGYAKLISIFAGSIVLLFVIKQIKLNYNYFSLRILAWIVIIGALLFVLSYLNLVFYLVLSFLTIVYLTLKMKYFTTDELLLILKLINKENWSKKLLKI